MTTQNILNRLTNCLPTGPNQWRADCPNHKGEPQSMAVMALQCGVTRIVCSNGCKPTHIVSTLNLHPSVLFPPGINIDQAILDLNRDDRKQSIKLGALDMYLENEAFGRIRSNR